MDGTDANVASAVLVWDFTRAVVMSLTEVWTLMFFSFAACLLLLLQFSGVSALLYDSCHLGMRGVKGEAKDKNEVDITVVTWRNVKRISVYGVFLIK